MVRRVELGSEAISYIRQQLYEEDPMTRGLRDLPLESGTVFSFFPENFRMMAPDDFERGYPYDPADPDGLDRLLTGEIIARLSTLDKGMLLFHSFLHENDPPVKRIETPFFVMGEPAEARGRKICLFLSGIDALDPDQILGAFIESGQAPAIAQVTRYARPIVTGDVITNDACGALAHATDTLIVGAFADETKLIWQAPRLDRA